MDYVSNLETVAATATETAGPAPATTEGIRVRKVDYVSNFRIELQYIRFRNFQIF